ncbi:uncharacterized protein A4U43_C04F19930 [Asparagus officinalis]|uniref:Uncharacterized protein n=1 Tax=Asparagus officinalis TaxID=4686 RepID=A0A5P1F294_ASPOF|nr:uncharacterized protein A4U43_C04F19930 [Asparagus officinalis]
MKDVLIVEEETVDENKGEEVKMVNVEEGVVVNHVVDLVENAKRGETTVIEVSDMKQTVKPNEMGYREITMVRRSRRVQNPEGHSIIEKAQKIAARRDDGCSIASVTRGAAEPGESSNFSSFVPTLFNKISDNQTGNIGAQVFAFF